MNPDERQISGNSGVDANSVGVGGVGAMSAGQLVQPVQSAQLVQPAQSAQPVQLAQPIQPAQPMQYLQSMQQPMSTGTGDIMLAGVKQPKDKKKFILIGIGVVAIVISIVLAVMSFRSGFNGGTVASNAREAFNLYANYFLTGEVSTENVKSLMLENNTEEEVDDMTAEGIDLEVEDEESAEDDVEETVVQEEIGEGEAVEEMPEEDMKEMLEDMAKDTSYFEGALIGDVEDGDKYAEELEGYFEGFQELYFEEIGGEDEDENENGEDYYQDYDEEMEGYFNEYKAKLELIVAYYGDGDLKRETILEAYLNGGNEKAKELIDEKAGVYEGVGEVYETDYGALVRNYGMQSLSLIESYDKLGCVVNGDIDYECVTERATEDISRVSDKVGSYKAEMTSIVESCNDSMYSGLSYFANLVYDNEEAE